MEQNTQTPQMHPHAKFGIPISNIVKDLFMTQLF